MCCWTHLIPPIPPSTILVCSKPRPAWALQGSRGRHSFPEQPLLPLCSYDGTSDLATVESYDPVTNCWQPEVSMGTRRSCLGVALLVLPPPPSSCCSVIPARPPSASTKALCMQTAAGGGNLCVNKCSLSRQRLFS
uniref:Uncharacterized protein n=1 Tax=Zonotrichia albicollis TaxID=44394 RepID=A0A8D2MAZ4_ZONAL